MRRSESTIGAAGLLDMLYEEPLSTCKRAHEELEDSVAVSNECYTSPDEEAPAKKQCLPEAGRSSIDVVLPPFRVGSSSAEAQARSPTSLPVSHHSP